MYYVMMNHKPPAKQPAFNEQIASNTIIVIISIVFTGSWIAFAYYKGFGVKDAAGNTILLLHPIVPIFLIVLLFCIRHLIAIKSIVNILIVMVSVWLFINLLGVLTPFIFGFGLAYFFRFLLNAIQDIPLPKGKHLRLSRGYARAVLVALTLGAFALLFLYIIPQIGMQSQDMSRKLVRFYHQSIVPFIVGNTFYSVTIQPDNPNAFYLGTAHGIYHLEYSEKKTKKRPADSGNLIGQPIRAIATATEGQYQLYAVTEGRLYARANHSQEGKITQVWDEIDVAGQSVQTIAIPVWSVPPIYAGTDAGLYRSDDDGMTWAVVDFPLSTQPSIQSIAFSSEKKKTIYVASDQGVYRSASSGETWLPISLENLGDRTVQTLTVAAVDGNEQLYAGTSKGLYQWQSDGDWEALAPSAKLNASSVSLLASHPQQALCVGDITTLYHSTDPKTLGNLVQRAKEGILLELEKREWGREIADRMQKYLTTELPTLAQTGSEFVGKLVGAVVRHLSSIAIGFGGFLTTAFLTLMVLIYASQSFSRYVQNFINLFPDDTRDAVRLYLTEINQNMESFLRGQVTVILIISIISIAVYSIIGVPFALVVGLLAGVCNAIPTFGPFIGGAFAVLSLLMGFAAGDFETVDFLIRVAVLLGAIFGIQTIDNSLISPKVMSSAVDVDPLLIMFGVIIGASILGFWGVLLAIPIIVVIKSALTVSKEIRAQAVK
jgi:predicted PurR-regulated permease PerM